MSKKVVNEERNTKQCDPMITTPMVQLKWSDLEKTLIRNNRTEAQQAEYVKLLSSAYSVKYRAINEKIEAAVRHLREITGEKLGVGVDATFAGKDQTMGE